MLCHRMHRQSQMSQDQQYCGSHFMCPQTQSQVSSCVCICVYACIPAVYAQHRSCCLPVRITYMIFFFKLGNVSIMLTLQPFGGSSIDIPVTLYVYNFVLSKTPHFNSFIHDLPTRSPAFGQTQGIYFEVNIFLLRWGAMLWALSWWKKAFLLLTAVIITKHYFKVNVVNFPFVISFIRVVRCMAARVSWSEIDKCRSHLALIVRSFQCKQWHLFHIYAYIYCSCVHFSTELVKCVILSKTPLNGEPLFSHMRK